MKTSADCRGFTLVEVLTVVVILGIIGAVVGIHLGTRDDLRASSAARVLASDLMYLQSRAMARRQLHLALPTAGTEVRFLWGTSGSMQAVPHPVEPGPMRLIFDAQGRTRGIGRGVRLAQASLAGRQAIGFTHAGAPVLADADGNNRADLTSPAVFEVAAGDFRCRVLIHPVTGEISVQAVR